MQVGRPEMIGVFFLTVREIGDVRQLCILVEQGESNGTVATEGVY